MTNRETLRSLADTIYEADDRGLFCKHCGRTSIRHQYMRGVGFLCGPSGSATPPSPSPDMDKDMIDG